jgi:imidazole glycerol-phosphate synthase subunit HisF
MKRIRVIPVLLYKDGGLYKSVRFQKLKYIGDPINTVKIFNEKEVDEIVLLDIAATVSNRAPDMDLISKIATEAFMPVAYGGGITTMAQVKEILYSGVEKVIFNHALIHHPELIQHVANIAGSSSVVASIDFKRDWLGRLRVFTDNGTVNTGKTPLEIAVMAEKLGVGEILVNSIDRDGTYNGYDLDVVNTLASAVNVPLVACGGGGDLKDFKPAIVAGASAIAAGSMFVFKRPHNAVLISYPTQDELKNHFYSLL